MRQRRIINNNFGWLGVIELLIAAIIIGVVFLAYTNFTAKRSAMDSRTAEDLRKEGIDTTDQSTIFQSTKDKISELEKRNKTLSKDIEKELGDF